ncbi:MAG: DUF3187 family protein [Planctomycetes bacterium]|nr:DUF3187 family protein [Planctomycetota bacterium]
MIWLLFSSPLATPLDAQDSHQKKQLSDGLEDSSQRLRESDGLDRGGETLSSLQPKLTLSSNLSGRGVLDLQDPFPISIFHLQLPTDTLELLDAHQTKLGLSFNWANHFARDDSFVVDAETYRLRLEGWYALREDFYLGADISLIGRGDGILDPAVDLVHHAFKFGEGSRDTRPRNQYDITIFDEDSIPRRIRSGIGNGDLSVKAHWILNGGETWLPAVALDGIVGLPTSTPGFGSRSIDFGIAVSAYKSIFDFIYLYGVLGGTYLTDPTTAGLEFKKVNYQGTLGVEIALLKRLSLIGQVMYFSPLLEEPHSLNKGRNYLAGGLKWQVLAPWELELSVVENIQPFNNSADIAFSLGFTSKF